MTLECSIDRDPKSLDITGRETSGRAEILRDTGPARPQESPYRNGVCCRGRSFQGLAGHCDRAYDAGEVSCNERLPLSENVVGRKGVVSRRSAKETHNGTLSVCIELR